MGSLAPFVPSPPSALKWLRKNLRRLLGMSRAKGQPVVYEAGCGEGIVARLVADITKSYVVCLEIDSERVEASMSLTRRSGLDLYIDHVEGDLSSFYLRRADLVYAYLFPGAMKPLYDRLPEGSLLLSLDFSVPGKTPLELHEIGAHGFYLYRVER